MPDITLVIVNYFSAALARDAISSARKTTAASLKVVVVDNSCSDEERRLAALAGADEVIEAPRNLGYAGGANRGAGVATTPVIVVANPDVVFGEACLDRLAAELRPGVAVAGPAIHWDAGGKWMLPPADLLGVGEKLSQVLACRSAAVARFRDRSRLKHRIAFWRRAESGPVGAVSGAVMAIDRARFDAVGGFDPRYELYFEEIDLVRRLGARGGSTRHVPAARCRHLYNQSAGRDPESSARFLRSEDTYLERWAPLARPILRRLARAVTPDESAFEPVEPDAPVPLPGNEREWLVEASPLWSFDSAAGCFATGPEVRFPEEVWSTYRSPALYLRVVDPAALTVAGRYVMRSG